MGLFHHDLLRANHACRLHLDDIHTGGIASGSDACGIGGGVLHEAACGGIYPRLLCVGELDGCAVKGDGRGLALCHAADGGFSFKSLGDVGHALVAGNNHFTLRVVASDFNAEVKAEAFCRKTDGAGVRCPSVGEHDADAALATYGIVGHLEGEGHERAPRVAIGMEGAGTVFSGVQREYAVM